MIEAPVCYDRQCKHYRGIIQPDGTEMSERPACDAYPEGIPEDIQEGKDLHLKVRPDQDNSITYEPAF